MHASEINGTSECFEKWGGGQLESGSTKDLKNTGLSVQNSDPVRQRCH